MQSRLPETHFSDVFEVDASALEDAGVFNISLISDFPLFIDPFLLFNSTNPIYVGLHEEIIRYLRFLRDKSLAGNLGSELLSYWFMFSEVKQTWLGFSEVGNAGRGLGFDFAKALHNNLHTVFSDFDAHHVSHGTHLEKLCLVRSGVGRDNISDFTTNLIKGHLLQETQRITQQLVDNRHRARFSVPRVQFNYATESWNSGVFELPCYRGDYVILTPKNILTRGETWINRSDMIDRFEQIVPALPDPQLRALLNNYFRLHLPSKPTRKERRWAAEQTLAEFPQAIDYYIRYKEEWGEGAVSVSSERVAETQRVLVTQLRELVQQLEAQTQFYDISGDTHSEALQRILYLKDLIENKGCYRILYGKDGPLASESDIQILYRIVWYATPSDVSREVNDGRGPADFKISRGSKDKTIVEFKLASNTQLKRNLMNQVPVYKQASDAERDLKVIIYFTEAQLTKVKSILAELDLTNDPDIILIDARQDNKPSASMA